MHVNAFCEEDMRKWAVEDLHLAEMIEWDVGVFCEQAKALIDMAWDRVAEGIEAREDGRAGCLQGKIEDYLHKLDDMIAMKNASFAKNREALQQRTDGGNPELENLVNTMRDQCTILEANFNKMVYPKP